MPRPSDISVRHKLTAITVLSAGTALALACVAFVAYELVTFRDSMVRTLASEAQMVARQSTSAVVFKDPESATATLSALAVDPHVVAAGIYTPEGALFASFVRAQSPAARVPTLPPGQTLGHAFDSRRLILFRPIEFDGAPVGTVVIESDLAEMATRLKRYAAIVACVILGSFLVAHWTASRLQRSITGPILHLAATARAVSVQRDYSVRAVTDGRDELGLLVRTFNEMLDQIQERDKALQKARDVLEHQVDERTLDLQKEIGERRSLEEELRRKNADLEQQSVRVQQATRLKSEFLANMSHELRTPLNAIIGFSELVHDGKVGPVSADQKECLADILTSSRHLLQLINDVLDLSKVEAGKMEFRPEPVDVARIAGEVRDILRSLSAQKQIRVSSELAEDLDGVVADPGKLKQVLYNYLSNALKFTPEGGQIVLRVRAEGKDAFRLEVEDDGIGIRPEDLPRLFVEFQQLDASAAKSHPGTGLGLALTKRIVEAQGGRVGVASVPGRGSRFFAVLPRRGRLLEGADSASYLPLAAEAGAPTILVVEDDAKDRAGLVDALAGAGYGVEVASTGREALDCCARRSYDAITLDLLLSDMGGADVLRVVRDRGINRATPVILVTVVAEKGVAAGFAIHDYLTKPVSPEALLASLKRAGVGFSGEARPGHRIEDGGEASGPAAVPR